MTVKKTADDGNAISPGKYQAIVSKKPRKQEEHRFEINLATAASYLKCAYIKIPDPIYGSRRVREMKEGNVFTERRRPFDAMLIVNSDAEHTGGIYAIEAKYGNNGLEAHQRNYLALVNKINGMAYVIRCKLRDKGNVYYVEWPEKNILFETDNLNDFISWFKELSRKK